VAQRRRQRSFFRDQGHADTVKRSYRMSPTAGATFSGSDVAHVWETGELFLGARQALESNRPVVLQPFTPARLEASDPGAAVPAVEQDGTQG
jgi:hypothetical protein